MRQGLWIALRVIVQGGIMMSNVNRKEMRFATLMSLALVLVFFYSNCSQFKSTPSESDFSLSSLVSTNGLTVRSPFTLNKLRIEVPISGLSLAITSQHLTTANLTASSNLSEQQDLKLQMIADNKCLKTLSTLEVSQLLGSSVSFDYSKQSSKISIQSYPLTINGSVTYAELETLSNSKPCIIGVTRNTPVQTTGANLPAPLQNAAHLNYLKMDQALAAYPTDLQNSGEPVVIAVVDTGVDTDHPHLAPLIWSDKNGNRNFNFSKSTNMNDGNGHGTHVSGLALSMTDFNPKIAKIMAVKVLGDDGSGYSADVFNGIMFAIENGANVINLSLSGRNIGAPFEYIEASWRALNRNVLMVVAAGNNNESVVPLFFNEDPNGTTLLNQGPWPSGLSPIAGLINVGSIDASTGQRSSFSNYSHNGFVELSAPGCDLSVRPFTGLKSTIPGGGYNSFCGTSMASPVVTGASALLIKYFKNRNINYTSRGIERELLDNGAKKFQTTEFLAELDAVALTQNLSNRAPASNPKENGPDLNDPYVQIVVNLFTTYLQQNYTIENLTYYVDQLKNNKKSIEWLAKEFIAGRPEKRIISTHNRSCSNLSALLHLGLSDRRVNENGYTTICETQNISDSKILHAILLSKDMFARLENLGLTHQALFTMDEGKNIDAMTYTSRKLISTTVATLLHRTVFMEDLMLFANQDPSTITQASIAANSSISNEIFLLGLYANILEKDIDNLQIYARDGVLFWLGKLNSGYSRESVQNDFLNSDEKFVIDQVKLYLGATPGYLGSVAYYLGQLQGGAMTRETLVAELQKRAGENPELASVIKSIYQKYFGRDPEAAGLSYWAFQYRTSGAMQLEANIIYGTSETDRVYVLNNTANVARAFLTSNGLSIPDWLKGSSSQPPKNSAAEAVIAGIYQKYYGRVPDAPGLNYWILQYTTVSAVQLEANILSGTSVTDRQYVLSNTASIARAFLTNNGIAIPDWLKAKTNNNANSATEAAITAIYQKYFGHAPDTAGLNYWLGQYNTRGAVQTEIDIILSAGSVDRELMLQSRGDEARMFLSRNGILIPDWMNPAVIAITNIYMRYFGHAPDQAGLGYWVTQYSSRGAVQTEVDILYGAGAADRAYVLNNTAHIARAFLNTYGIPLPGWL